MLEKYLQEIGLSEKEAQVYLALLQVDSESIQDIAKNTGINRTTVYPVLETLEKKGLVTEVEIGKKTHYQGEPPERLETYVERQKVTLEEHAKRLRDIIPQIKSVQREQGERPIVKYFEGKEGIISSMEEMYTSKDQDDTAYLVYSKDLLDSLFTTEERGKYKKIRLGKEVRTKVLYTYSKGEITNDSTGERIKIDEQKYPITCDISIYEDRVRINTLGKSLSGIFIKSKDVAETLRSIFSVAFDQLKK
jgi:sugar-specific transcriptional regulator TrmB